MASSRRDDSDLDYEMDGVRQTTTRTTKVTTKSSRNDGARWHARYLPLIILTVLFVGALAALIGVSVMLVQKTEELAKVPPQPTSAPPTTTVEPPVKLPPGDLRLRNTVKPSHYDLFLQVDFPYDASEETAESWTTKGTVSITLSTDVDNVSSILLHARHEVPAGSKSGHLKRFSKENVTLTKVEAGAVPVVVESLEYKEKDNVVINLASNLEKSPPAPGVKIQYVLKIEFEGYVADDNQGLYRGQYTKADGSIK